MESDPKRRRLNSDDSEPKGLDTTFASEQAGTGVTPPSASVAGGLEQFLDAKPGASVDDGSELKAGIGPDRQQPPDDKVSAGNKRSADALPSTSEAAGQGNAGPNSPTPQATREVWIRREVKEMEQVVSHEDFLQATQGRRYAQGSPAMDAKMFFFSWPGVSEELTLRGYHKALQSSTNQSIRNKTFKGIGFLDGVDMLLAVSEDNSEIIGILDSDDGYLFVMHITPELNSPPRTRGGKRTRIVFNVFAKLFPHVIQGSLFTGCLRRVIRSKERIEVEYSDSDGE